MTARRRVAVMISGRGSNMAALIEAARDPAYPAEIVGVISSRAEARGLETAAAAGIGTHTVLRRDYAEPADHDAAVGELLSGLDVEIVCLAGYMRLLTAGFVSQWAGRMINIHPALLPLFRGLDTHGRALRAGMRIHGCTVHFVTPEMDEGPIIAQSAVPVLLGDDAESLAARVLRAEHELYPRALRMVAEGKARMAEGRTVFSGIHEDDAAQHAVLRAPEGAGEGVDLEALARFTP